jgi:hypothetical protein
MTTDRDDHRERFASPWGTAEKAVRGHWSPVDGRRLGMPKFR